MHHTAATADALGSQFPESAANNQPAPSAEPNPGFRALKWPAQVYVAAVILWGAVALVGAAPGIDPYRPLFIVLLITACLLSAWKITLPISVSNGSTLSVADAANIMSLLLLGPSAAAVIAAAGVWVQCTHRPKQPYPLYRTLFSVATAALTLSLTGSAYAALGGTVAPAGMSAVFAEPLAGALAAYFLFNTAVIAGAISLSTGRSLTAIWRDDFLWSASSFMIAGVAGAIGAVVVVQGEHWKVLLLIAPIYLTYRTYLAFVGRLDSEQRHTGEIRGLHQQTMTALRQAREAEHALANEKERLAAALAEMTRLEGLRHELLEREQASRLLAENANRVKDQFLAVVSHELRTPLNAILGWADMMCRGKLDDVRRDRAAQTIRDSARRQARLIDDLLDVARITSGKLRLQRSIIDFKEVVSDALQVVLPVSEAKGVRVSVEIPTPVEAVYADGARLQQVVWNLLSNAVKFTPAGGTVTVRVRQAHRQVELTVEDSGQGIDAEFLPMIFEPFRQADPTSTRTHPGLGLGLAIVRSLVEAHGGTITACSEGEGRGASFTVTLPSAGLSLAPAADGAGIPAVMDSVIDTTVRLDGIFVLLVDDEADSREVVAAELHGAGAMVTMADSAAAAFDLIQREHVDVLVADIGMPGEDGYSLIRRIRALPITSAASVPAAALTALARREDRQQALQAGFQMHLTKPVDIHSLASAVSALHRLNAN